MRLIERRIGLLFAAFLLCFLVILGRAFWVQGVKGPTLASEAAAQQTDVVTVPGLRGSLLDRNGNELAASEDAATIYATPYQVKNPPRTADKLAPVLGLNANAVLRSLTANSGFSYVAHKVDLVTAAKISAMKLPGIGQLPDSRRTYPQGELAAQVIGAVGAENQGLTGLEAGEKSVLHGTDGERRIVNDALGEPIRLDTVKEANDGQNVQLTLDPAIQAKTEQVLAEVGEAYQPKGATAIVMDPRNSQILAMANWPPVSPRTSPPPAPRTSRTGPPASPTSRARPSRRSPSPPRSRTSWSRRRPPSPCRRASRSPIARSQTPRPARP